MAPALLTTRPRILYLDAYDSFSNNIIALVEQHLDADVTKVHIDEPVFLAAKPAVPFAAYIQDFDAVIAGPGPGWAKNDKDVGLMQQLWDLQDTQLVPVLGICLGFQSLCLAHGADIQCLTEPRHGLVSEILHNGTSIFSHVEQLLATQYHSLQVIIDHCIQTKRAVRYPAELWEPTQNCPELEPLAWDFDSQKNGAVLQAVKHTSKPFCGIQFHPESICTNSEGVSILRNWWGEAQEWNRRQPFQPVACTKHQPSMNITTPRHPLDISALNVKNEKLKLLKGLTIGREICSPEDLASLIAYGDGISIPSLPPDIVQCMTIGSGRLTVADVCEEFDLPENEAIVLESGLQPDLIPMKVGTGRYSIIGLVIPGETLRLHYYADTKLFQLRDGNDEVLVELQVSEPWVYIKAAMERLKPKHTPSGPTFAPFWGGLMGYASYEAGLETIDVSPSGKASLPDICFAYITRSIVFDHQLKKIYVQSIRGNNDSEWITDARERIYEAAGRKSMESTPNPTPLPRANPFDKDATLIKYLESCRRHITDSKEYCQSVADCQDIIANGHSYELCLTTTNEIHADKPAICQASKAEDNSLSWKLYNNLTKQNPSPFSAYMRMHNMHVLSSSPERYICWDRMQNAQCRPIKGTVQKTPELTTEDAYMILSSSKERAENLMIVDLVRHQLHGVYGSGNVHVSQLMEVEEYETLWQLVSVVDAVPSGVEKPSTPDQWEEPSDFMSPKKGRDAKAYLGFDAFVQSLPPGSMTGAPKKRSCGILQDAEKKRRRGIYSGVLGYLDVGGAGDFSVVIRTAVKVDHLPDEDTDADADTATDVWKIGAGGAITSQSSPQAEYEEMVGKFQSTARAFTYQPPPADTLPEKGDPTQHVDLARIQELIRSRILTMDRWFPGPDLEDGDVEDDFSD